MKKSDIFWQTYLNFEKELLKLSKYIFFSDEIIIEGKTQKYDAQLETFSPYIADILISCCVQIEAISKELYFCIGGEELRGSNNIRFDTDCLKLINEKWNTNNKRITIIEPLFNFTKDENRNLRPLKNAHKSKGTYWERAYQAVKHDRYTYLHLGNVKSFLHALAALYLLNLYNRNDSWETKYLDISKYDYSMGSKIFSVCPPATDQLWYGNKAIESDSPYVVTYKTQDYMRIKQMQDEEYEALNNYWKRQPELKEFEFKKQIQEALQNKQSRVLELCELSKYRLNKKIPKNLPLQDRISKLKESAEWKYSATRNGINILEKDITENNIQIIIDSVGYYWGYNLMNQFQKLEWIPVAMHEQICEVYIPK